jgi:hypothetical protein
MGLVHTPPQLTPQLQEVLQVDPRRMRASPMFTAALVYARAGFRLVPCEEDSKRPHIEGSFQHGARSASADYERVRDHWDAYPFDNLGLAPDGTYVLIDVDPRTGGSLEKVEALGLPIDGYREQTVTGGWRVPLVMPQAVSAVTSCIPVPGVEIKTQGTYALAPHSRIGNSWYRPEADRDVWRFAEIPASWPHLGMLVAKPSHTSSMVILPEDQKLAREIMDRLQFFSTCRETVALILDGRWKDRYPSRSEVDSALVTMASHFLRNVVRRREVLVALLERHSLKAASHANPELYLRLTVDNAIQHRDAIDTDHVSALSAIIAQSLATWAKPDVDGATVTDPTFQGATRRGLRGRELMQDILAFAGSPIPDLYSLDGGWRRLPVNHMSSLHAVSPESVRRAQVKLASSVMIERDPKPKRHDGAPRMDARIRITPNGVDALEAFRRALSNLEPSQS